MKRRFAFAAPFVVVACTRPVKHEPEYETKYEQDEAPRSPEPIEPTPLQVKPSPRVPYTPPSRSKIVDELPPLLPEYTIEDRCARPRVRCNPPPPYPKQKPSPVATVSTEVELMKREAAGTRVRLDRKSIADTKWRAVFVGRDGLEVPNGECKIVEWRYSDLECTTALTPEEIGDGDNTLDVKLVPPPDLVARIDREIAAWGDAPDGGKPRRVRIIHTEVSGDAMIVRGAHGRSQGIDRNWRAKVVDASDRPAPNGECQIVRVDDRMTICKTKLSPDDIRKYGFLLFEAPLK